MKKRKKKVFLRRMRLQLAVVMVAFTVCLVFLIARIVYINLVSGPKYKQRVLNQKGYNSVTVPFKRGDIIDRNGTVLATSNKIYNLVIEPANILQREENKEATVKALKEFFDITDEEMTDYLKDEKSFYKVIRKKLEYPEVRKFKDYCKESDEGRKVIGVWFEEDYVRYYPYNEMACHLLGFTVSGNQGLSGIEGYYDDELNGEPGRTYSYINNDFNVENRTEPALNGYSLVTSLDIEVQKIVQKNCEEYMQLLETKNVSVLVMDPNNCEVLAIYNCHQYDPNKPYDTEPIRYQFKNEENGNPMTDQEFEVALASMTDADVVGDLEEVWRDYAVSDNYEPGSTYKTFTISGAVEEKKVALEDQFYCQGYLQVADATIRCHHVTGHGMVTTVQALEQSCNPALMQIAKKEGKEDFDKYQKLFGFGQRTNIDLNGEPSAATLNSLVYDVDSLNSVELATSSFGQGVTVTMMQLGTAFCSVINGGNYYQPHVVKQIIDSDGNVIENKKNVLVRKTISEETSDTMKEMLRGVVVNGTGKKAAVEGYSIGGKTGTAEKLPRGQRKYILSFIGFAPVENPEVVIYCLVDEPDPDSQYFTSTGCILFNMIAEDLLPYLNIYKEETDNTDPFAGGQQITTEVTTEAVEEQPAVFATGTDAQQGP
ncbi:MAG: penicillin-binding protein 2 [Eubacterium sp.]|nr:penicillin-binding protein 2 [Eubacterium sp.]